MVHTRVVNFLQGRTNEYKKEFDKWEAKCEQESTNFDNEIKDIKNDIEKVKTNLEEVKKKISEQRDIENKRLMEEEKQKKDAIEKERKEKAKENAIKWIQKKLVELHPFKPVKKRGKMMAAMPKMM